MFDYIFMLFVVLSGVKINMYLQFENNKNLSYWNNEEFINFSIISYKYDLLKKLKSNNYNKNQKIQLLSNDTHNYGIDIYNEDIFKDFNL